MGRVKRAPNSTPIPEKIVEASMKVFGAVGYESASMKAIAKEAGVTPAALYYHYKDKRELLAKCLELIATLVVEAIRIDPDEIEADPRESLVRFVSNYIGYQLTSIRSIAPMYTSLVHGVQRKRNALTEKQLRAVRAIEHQNLDILKSILDAGRKQGIFSIDSPTMTAFAIIGMSEHTLSWVNPGGKSDVKDITRYFSRLALRLVSADDQRS